jgi:hypothetical protein
MTAGVQNSDSAAYLPAPRSSSSSASDPKGADPLPDFQSELQLHDPDPKETKTAGRPEKSSGKLEKNRDTPEKAPNLTALTPVQIAEPAKQILPLVLALPQPGEPVKVEENPHPEVPANQETAVKLEVPARLEAFTKPDDQTKESSRQSKQDAEQPSAVRLLHVPQSAKVPEPVGFRRPATTPEPAEPPKSPVLPNSAELPQPVDLLQAVATPQQVELSKPVERQETAEIPQTVVLLKSVDLPSTIGLDSAGPPPNPAPVVNAAAWATPDTLQAQVVQVAAELPVQKEAARNMDQAAVSAESGASSATQPDLRDELKLADAIPPEPAATAVAETVDSASPSPAPLAFAARIAAAPQNADQPIPGSPSQPPAASGPPTPVRIPVRYAPTAQILASNPDKQGQGFKRDADAAIDSAPRTNTRTDMILPRVETAPEAGPPISGPAAPPQPGPIARQEPIIEPPAAPRSSAHNFSVRVPDNNGGWTQVRFVESGGEVRVSVRTADEGLAQNLRTHLNDLSQRLAEGGIPAEIWKPAADAASPQNNNQHQPDRDGRGSNGQPSGGQDGQSDRQQKRPAWLEEMEASLLGPQV